MKKLLAISTIILAFAGSLSAQEVSEPKDINVQEFDEFKNSSFTIQEESATLLESVTAVESEIKNYSGVMNTIGVEKLRNNYKALRDGILASSELTSKITKLSAQGQDLVKKAKSVKPITKAGAASKNTKQSMKALDVGKGNLAQVKEKIDANIDLLKEELTSRGELIE